MPKTAAKFGSELQLTLQPMIVKPSGTGGLAVREAVTPERYILERYAVFAGGSGLYLLRRSAPDTRLPSLGQPAQVLQWLVVSSTSVSVLSVRRQDARLHQAPCGEPAARPTQDIIHPHYHRVLVDRTLRLRQITQGQPSRCLRPRQHLQGMCCSI
jgi:hypothetical protein